MRIVNGLVFNGEGFASGSVSVEGDRFTEVAFECDPDAAAPACDDAIDAAGCYVIPGLVDVHFHGAAGADTCDATPEALATIAAYEASRGVTGICPTTMTLPEERLAPIMANVAAFAGAEAPDQAQVLGINMEGPYIAAGKVGAQNPGYVRPASVGEFARLQDAAQGLIRLVDVAPEVPGNLDFIRQVAGSVRVSVAHTCADYDTARAAFDAGALQVTHLYNAMPALHHRDPGPIPAAVEHAGVAAEIIADGIHIHASMVRLAFRLFGAGRMILISDSLRACGLPDGTYELGGQEFTLRGRRATIANGSLAGSASDLMACLRTAVLDMGIPLAQAVRAASTNPARAVGAADRGAIAPGNVADAVVLDANLNIKHVILRGKLL